MPENRDEGPYWDASGTLEKLEDRDPRYVSW